MIIAMRTMVMMIIRIMTMVMMIRWWVSDCICFTDLFIIDGKGKERK